ncbi:MAG: DUF2497 domain-containing protein [Alphaproteobacteria bacterium]|nr:DUF2497 domain-containing protein [Alphaproteobacteria bacterium]
MADENNQEMAMEDILSSIKNILEEDQLSSADIENAVATETPIISEDEEDDDVLELSPDMRFAESSINEQPNNKTEDLDLDKELSDVTLPEIKTISDTQDASDISSGVSIGSEDFDSDPFYEEEEGWHDEIEEPISSKEDDTQTFSSDVEEEPKTIQEQAPQEIVEIIAEPETEQEPEPEPEQEPETAFEAEPETNIVEPVHETQSEPEMKEEQEPDASASIISSFAKIFSHEEKSEHTIRTAAPSVINLGDGSKTIEEVVASVVKQIIGEEVSIHWQDGLDYDVLAREEIARQTSQWVEKNLPALVEKIIKQEIERVMAKVGSNQ